MPLPTTPDPFLLSADDDDLRRIVITAARSLLGTPFKVHGAGPGGVDCTGLCLYAAHAAGFSIADFSSLDPETSGDAFLNEVRARMTEIEAQEAVPGDWFAQTYKGAVRHFALLSENGTLIKASYLRNAVVEHDFNEREQSRVSTAFRYTELA